MEFGKLPPLNELAAFEAVARHKSFTKASQELCLTPSAISQRLRQLEEHLGARLFVRDRRSVALSAEGARYLEAVREALSTLSAASEGFSATPTKRLRVSVVPALASNWLIYRLRDFRKRFPDVDLDIQSAIAMANVGSDVDVAIRWGKGDWSGLEKVLLFPDELVPVCSDGYLEEIGPLQSPAQLRRAVLIRNAIQPWKPWLESAGLDWPEPAQGPSFNDSTLALQAAVDGLGIALGRRMLVAHLLDQGALVQPLDVTAKIEEAFYVVYVRDSLERPEVKAFVDWISSVAAEEQAAT